MTIEQKLINAIQESIHAIYELPDNNLNITLEKTKKEFKGQYTFIVFAIAKIKKESPEVCAKKIGDHLLKTNDFITDFSVVKGFLNISIKANFWLNELEAICQTENYGFEKQNSKSGVLVEYSSPNTNKPLHLGHIRNNFLGYSIAEILKANGHQVHKVQIINDRGIHICKSMLAWQKFGKNETPETTGVKGDHFVGKYYVLFDQEYKKQIQDLIKNGITQEDAEKKAPLIIEAQKMLKKWEENDPETKNLWAKMNQWVYQGFEETYQKMGVDFDKLYYESDTFLLGKKEILEGLEKGILFQKEDQSIWCDLTAEGLGEKLLLRSDGTSVYMTQDIGTAILRHKDFINLDRQIYTVANEQDHHFKVLFLILEKLGFSWAKSCFHLSYGMVNLPTGKMKSREGTVVDADDLINEMILESEKIAHDLGKNNELTESEQKKLYHDIGLGALKYFILKVDPQKKMLFNPSESIDFNGNTGPFIQYTYARICALERKFLQENLAGIDGKTIQKNNIYELIADQEINLIQIVTDFRKIIQQAGTNYSPAIIANYVYELTKEFNSYYQNTPILKESNQELKIFRLHLTQKIGEIIQKSMNLLGINVPHKM